MTALAHSRRRATSAHARVAMNRRAGSRGGMRRGGGGFLPYSPTASPKLIETWLSYAGTTDDGGGLISAWQGQKAGKIFTAAAALRPTLTASQFGSMPGLVFDGASDSMVCTTVGSLITGATGVTVIMVAFDVATAVAMAFEYSVAFASNAGAFAMIVNDANAHSIEATCFGNVGMSTFRSDANTAPLVVPGVVSMTYDFTLAASESSVTLDNVAIAGSMVVGQNANNTGAMGNYPMYLGSRAGTSFWWPGSVGAVAVYRALTAAELTVEARGLGALFGGIVVA